MPDIRSYDPALNNDVTSGGATVVTLGAGTTPAICCGSNVPTMSAPKGSLYLRTDGSSASTRAYIATDSSGTWTAITTAG